MSRGSKRKPKKEVRRAERSRKFSGEIILIVCEGGETEPIYFEELRKKWKILKERVRILEDAGGLTPISLVDFALDRKTQIKKSDGIIVDEVWLVFDHEGCNKDARYEEAVNKARDNNLKIARSWPCFEYWFLLHYVYTTKSIEKCLSVIKELKKHIKKYNKSKNYFATLYPKLQTALSNADKVRKHNKKSNTICPATDVDLLIAKLESLKRI